MSRSAGEIHIVRTPPGDLLRLQNRNVTVSPVDILRTHPQNFFRSHASEAAKREIGEQRHVYDSETAFHSMSALLDASSLLPLRAIIPIKATLMIMRQRMIEPTITTGVFILGRIMA